MIIKLACLIAFAGHFVCGITDCMMAYSDKGRFQFSDIKDPEKMSSLFEKTSPKRLEISMILGVFSLFAAGFGFVAVSKWMSGFSDTAGIAMMISSLLFLVLIASHHVLCGGTLWFYVRLGRTSEALEIVTEFFKKTLIVSVAYVGLLAFDTILFVMVITGKTSLPNWACLCNTLTFFLLLVPTKAAAKGNIANAAMFLSLCILL